jgi:hypothetical protein
VLLLIKPDGLARRGNEIIEGGATPRLLQIGAVIRLDAIDQETSSLLFGGERAGSTLRLCERAIVL